MPKNKLRKECNKVVAHFLTTIQHQKPVCVLLFGSYATGNFTEHSDIDLCVIAEKLPSSELARRALSITVPRIRAIGFYPNEFIRFLTTRRLLAYDIISDAHVLYDKDGFYQYAKKVYENAVTKFGLVRENNGWRFTVITGKEREV